MRMTTEAHFTSYSEAQAHFKDLLDTALQGRRATVRFNADRAAVVDAERLRASLMVLHPSRAHLVAEAGGRFTFIPGVPIAAGGPAFAEASSRWWTPCANMPLTGRITSEAPNHRDNWAMVQLITLSDDDQLRHWPVGTQA